MGCTASKDVVRQTVPASNGKPNLFVIGNTRTVNVEKRPDSGRGSSAYTDSSPSEPKQLSALSSHRPPHHIPKLHVSDQHDHEERNGQSLVKNINTAPKGISYELKIDPTHDNVDGASIVKSHPPKALRRLEVPHNVKMNYDKLMQDLQEAEERKAKLMKERKEQCQSRRAGRTTRAEMRRTSLESRDQPHTMVTNVEVVHGDF